MILWVKFCASNFVYQIKCWQNLKAFLSHKCPFLVYWSFWSLVKLTDLRLRWDTVRRDHKTKERMTKILLEVWSLHNINTVYKYLRGFNRAWIFLYAGSLVQTAINFNSFVISKKNTPSTWNPTSTSSSRLIKLAAPHCNLLPVDGVSYTLLQSWKS